MSSGFAAPSRIPLELTRRSAVTGSPVRRRGYEPAYELRSVPAGPRLPALPAHVIPAVLENEKFAAPRAREPLRYVDLVPVCNLWLSVHRAPDVESPGDRVHIAHDAQRSVEGASIGRLA